MGLLNRATMRSGLGFGQDGVDGAHMVAHRLRYRQTVDGGKHLPDIMMMPIGHACGIGRSLKTLPSIRRQLQQGVAQKLATRGVLGKVPSKNLHVGFLFSVLIARALYHVGLIPRAETVVDIDHGNARRARIEHGKKRSHAAEAGAVAHRRGNGDHGTCGHPAHHAGKRAFHARHRHHAAGTCDVVLTSQQAVNARNPHIIQTHHARTEHLGGDGSLLSAV